MDDGAGDATLFDDLAGGGEIVGRPLRAVAAVIACGALLGACGSESTPTTKADIAKQEFEDATLSRVGPFAFVRLDPKNLSAYQRSAMRTIFGGHFVSNGFLIPVQKVVASCRTEILNRDACEAFFKQG